jgi:hypothetical protein
MSRDGGLLLVCLDMKDGLMLNGITCNFVIVFNQQTIRQQPKHL